MSSLWLGTVVKRLTCHLTHTHTWPWCTQHLHPFTHLYTLSTLEQGIPHLGAPEPSKKLIGVLGYIWIFDSVGLTWDLERTLSPLLLVLVAVFENGGTRHVHTRTHRAVHIHAQKLVPNSKSKAAGSTEGAWGSLVPRMQIPRIILSPCLLALALSPSATTFLHISFSVFPCPCSVLVPARPCSLPVASQPLCTPEVIRLHHPTSEWQAGERRRLQKNRLSSPLIGS